MTGQFLLLMFRFRGPRTQPEILPQPDPGEPTIPEEDPEIEPDEDPVPGPPIEIPLPVYSDIHP
jgi:hypothetical protein